MQVGLALKLNFIGFRIKTFRKLLTILTERIGGLKDEKNLSAQKTSQKNGTRFPQKNV